MKEILKRFALWLLDKTDRAELKKIRIDLETVINLEKYVPKKNKWYHVGTTIDWFIKRENKEISKFGDVKIYIDSELEAHWVLDD